MAVQLSTFLAALQQMADARPTYRTGGSGKDGTCDCIGLIIGALRIAGYRWPGIIAATGHRTGDGVTTQHKQRK